MRKTKCLFPDGASPEGMVSVSQLQTFMSCPQKWEYGYIDEITPRVERPYLSVGKLCHKGMETAMRYKWKYERGQGWCRENALNMALLAMEDEWDEYINNTPFTNEELSEQMQVYWDAVEVFCQAFWEFDIDKYDVVTLRGADGEIPALELHFLVPCPGSKGLHGYIDAILKERSTGMVWCTDYKFRRSLSPDEEEAFNIQNAVYQHACSRMGINITGTMTWQHVNTPAAKPQQLKNGKFSRAKIKTTWTEYAECVKAAGQNPEDYREEMEQKLADIEWFRATKEYRNLETVQRMWDQVIVPASRGVHRAYKTVNPKRLYPWNCKMCQYQSLCQAELRGYDVEAIKLRDYTVRAHRKESVNKPLDTTIPDVV